MGRQKQEISVKRAAFLRRPLDGASAKTCYFPLFLARARACCGCRVSAQRARFSKKHLSTFKIISVIFKKKYIAYYEKNQNYFFYIVVNTDQI